MHIAAAAYNSTGERPVIISLFGQTDTDLYGLLDKRHYTLKGDIDCIPCGNMEKCSVDGQCMKEINTEEVISIIEKEIEQVTK